MKKSVIILISLIVMIASSCSKPPNEEMDAAAAAVEQAEADADTSQYAGASVAAARALLIRMRAEADARKYDLARDLALEAKNEAENAIRIGAAAKKRASAEAQEAIATAKTMFSDVLRTLNAAQDVRKISFNFSGAREEMAGISEIIIDAEDDFDRSDFTNAQAKAQDARSATADIQKRIADATQIATREK